MKKVAGEIRGYHQQNSHCLGSLVVKLGIPPLGEKAGAISEVICAESL